MDNETLARLLANDDAMKAIMNIEGFRALNKDIETIINKSEAVKKAKKEKGDKMTPKEKKELSDEEKEYKSMRKKIQEKLIKFATRIPIFMYLTDFREYSLKDVITQFEPGLFKKVTGLRVKDFELLVSVGIFNDGLMNQAVYNFKRYEDASLEYTGINRHKEDEGVGLFSTVITREDYEDMAAAQTRSMTENPFRKVLVKTEPQAETELQKKAAPKKGTTQKQPAVKPTLPKPAPVPQNINPGYSVPGLSDPTSKVAETLPGYGKLDLSQLRVGTIVENQKYGIGKETGFKPGKILVSFSQDLKMFLMPSAFEKGHLKVQEW